MSHKLQISIFCPFYDLENEQNSRHFTYCFCEILPSSNANIHGNLALISPHLERDFDSCSLLVNPISEMGTSHNRWLNCSEPFFCIAYGEGFSKPILQLLMLDEQILFMHRESIQKKPVQVLELSISDKDQVDDGFKVHKHSNHITQMKEKDKIVLKSAYNEFLFYGLIKMVGSYSLNEYENLTGKDPVAIWEQKWIGDGSTDVKYTKSYQKMKMRFMRA